MTNQTPAQIIKKELKKEHGIKASQISAKMDGSSIEVEIKDLSVSYLAVKKVAEKFQRIDRDAFGEILAGGNVFVNVSFARDAYGELSDRLVELVGDKAETCVTFKAVQGGLELIETSNGWVIYANPAENVESREYSYGLSDAASLIGRGLRFSACYNMIGAMLRNR